jgi:hypothetical protein
MTSFKGQKKNSYILNHIRKNASEILKFKNTNIKLIKKSGKTKNSISLSNNQEKKISFFGKTLSEHSKRERKNINKSPVQNNHLSLSSNSTKNKSNYFLKSGNKRESKSLSLSNGNLLSDDVKNNLNKKIKNINLVKIIKSTNDRKLKNDFSNQNNHEVETLINNSNNNKYFMNVSEKNLYEGDRNNTFNN